MKDHFILLFGDQTTDSYSFLQQILHRSCNHPIVSLFLQQVASALRGEVASLTYLEQEKIPNFVSLADLLENYHEKSVKHAAIESVLLCITQFAHFIEYHEEVPWGSFGSSNTRILGICTGLLAAGAIASSTSITDLLPLALETVCIAFRLGCEVNAVADRVGGTCRNPESWSTTFGGVDELTAANMLVEFHRDTGIAVTNTAYISAVGGSNTVTISGPPSTLKRLQGSPNWPKSCTNIQLPVFAPYHAPHLNSQIDIHKVLGTHNFILEKLFSRYRPRLPLLSNITGKCIVAETTYSLFEQVLREILNQTLRWNCAVNECVSEVLLSGTSQCKVLKFGPTACANSLISALMSGTNSEISLVDTAISEERHSGDTKGYGDSRIAIVGLAGRFPGASDPEKLWDLLEKGLDVHREIPKDRFDVRSHVDPSGNGRNTSYTPYGCFIDNPGFFDPLFFSMSPREAAQTDPMQRLALVTAYEALEMAGYAPNRTPSTKLDRIGTFYGQTSDDYREINASQNIDTYFITGGIRAFGPGRINYHFKFSGPSFNIDTACSSSLSAIQLACTSIWSGDCDTAVAGGLSILTSPDLFSGLSKGQFLSKTGSCKTFDESCDGYCRADAIGTVILKRLKDAEADNDNILGVILGAATNHSAQAISITHPHAETQENLYKKVLHQGGIDPLDVDYIEMHGTGTQAGDGVEMRSIANVFAPATSRRNLNRPLYVGAVKSCVGHSEAASGVTALIKSLLMLQRNLIPPHCGIKGVINRRFPDLQERNINIALATTSFQRQAGRKRRLLVNNFSAAGGSTALLLEDYVSPSATEVRDSRPAHVITVSAKSLVSLRRNTERLLQYLDEQQDVCLGSLSYTTTSRRIQHGHRVAVVGSSVEQIRQSLAASLNETVNPAPKIPPRVIFVFTGQGTQYAALGKKLFDESKEFKAEIIQLDSIAQIQGFASFQSLIDGSAEVDSLSAVQVQLGITCVQMALTKLWNSWGVVPNAVAGHSLGEYAALHAAGVLSATETISLVGRRAQLLQEHCVLGTHVMLAVRAQFREVYDMLRRNSWNIEIACINGEEEVVLAGTSLDMGLPLQEFAARGYQHKILNVSYAFHSRQVDPILDLFENGANAICFRPPSMPVLSGLLGKPITEAGIFNPTYLRRHAREPVNFLGCLQAGQQQKLIDKDTIWVEIGPQPVCLGMVKSQMKGHEIAGVPTLRRNENAWKTAANSLRLLHVHGLRVNWAEYHRDFIGAHKLLNIPSYAFDEKNYWIDYRGDWSLTKGDTPKEAVAPDISPAKPAFSTASLHRIIQEDLQADMAMVVFESDFSDPFLHSAIMGHRVNFTALCPSSVFADMAFTAADYIHRKLRSVSPKSGMNIKDMEVSKPLILTSSVIEHSRLRVTATADLSATLGKVDIQYATYSTEASLSISHAKCCVEYGDYSKWLLEWSRNTYLIKSRLLQLENGVRHGQVHRIHRGMAYKLFSALVDYDKKYRGMEEVLLDSAELEARAKVAFQSDDKDGNFCLSPYWIDSLAHISGFVVNANDVVDSQAHVYISHGWESMRFARELSIHRVYDVYVKMQPMFGSKVMVGDVYILEGDEIVGLIGGLKFREIPRSLLDMLLPPLKIRTPDSHRFPISPATIARQSGEPAKNTPHARFGKPLSAQGPDIGDRVASIIAQEIGIPLHELGNSKAFSDLGVDSLLSLTITGKVREILGLPLPSNVFLQFPDMAGLRQFLRKENDYKTDNNNALPYDNSDFARTPTPALIPDCHTSQENSTESSSCDGDSISDILRYTIATEMGTAVDDLSSDVDLPSLGMDSLMALSVLGTLRQKTGRQLPSNLFLENRTISDVERSLNLANDRSEDSSFALEREQNGISQGLQPSSILLQGNPATSSKYLFLFPDGSGSATSYADLPNLSSEIVVFGLNSPYIQCPQQYTCGIDGVAKLYLREIKKRQPKGPYFFGGWSVGGVIAFEAASQLIGSGEVVESLVLIDSPCPTTHSPLPKSLVRFFDSIGIFGTHSMSNRAPPWLLEHFDSSVANLGRYRPKRLPIRKTPRVTAIWARDGVCKNPTDLRPLSSESNKSTHWIVENRTEFGANGWQDLLDGSKIRGFGVAGNHFTMMRDPNVQEVGRRLKEALF